MSAYRIHKSQIKSKSAILEAIADVVSRCKNMSIEKARAVVSEHVECHDEPVHMYGYQGDLRKDKATIVIRKPFVEKYMGGRASNDNGWLLDADGTYTEKVCDQDHLVWFTEASPRFYQVAMAHEAIEQASAAGYVLHMTEKKGNIELEAVMVGSGSSGSSHSGGW